jgi:opacity protein-like surface antigen
MNLRFSTIAALGLVALALTATDASAQRRGSGIPVRKGEVPQTRVDTVYRTSVDTVYRTRSDTVFRSRTDTVVQTREVMPAPLPLGRFYVAPYGGVVLPIQDLNTTHSPSWTAGLMLGWDGNQVPLGLRADVGYSAFGERSAYACGVPCVNPNGATVGPPQLLRGSLDAKLRIAGADWPIKPYLVGGVSYNRFRGFTFIDSDNPTTSQPNGAVVSSTDDWHDKVGGNFGGGIAFGFGRNNLFIESRYETMNISNSVQNHVPIIIGITF